MFSKIESLMEKYKDNEYMTQKLNHHINVNLENLLETIYLNHEERKRIRAETDKQKKQFVMQFLSNKPYYYCSQNEQYYLLDNSYIPCSSDNIHHEILTLIDTEHELYSQKHKMPNYVLKQIRERSLFLSIPETNTIQCVLSCLYPNVFKTKTHAKYFLTILGDSVLKKTQSLLYFLPFHAKDFINVIDEAIKRQFNNIYVNSLFKYKYHDHKYEECRLVEINPINMQFYSGFQKHIIELLCVSCHYSVRYKNADHFLTYARHQNLSSYSCFLKNNTLTSIIKQFSTMFIQTTDSYIKEKNMIFIWKKYLEQHKLPSICSSNQLKQELRSLFTFEEDGNKYLNITSLQLPVVSTFQQFWDKHISIDDTSENEFKLSEIVDLFLKDSKQSMDESTLLELIKHFYPSITIEHDKYILNICCDLWDKQSDIITAITEYKQSVEENRNVYDAYLFYCNLFSKTHIASKKYFEKVAKTLIN